MNSVNTPCFCLVLKDQAALKYELSEIQHQESCPEEAPQGTSQQASRCASYNILQLISFSQHS